MHAQCYFDETMILAQNLVDETEKDLLSESSEIGPLVGMKQSCFSGTTGDGAMRARLPSPSAFWSFEPPVLLDCSGRVPVAIWPCEGRRA